MVGIGRGLSKTLTLTGLLLSILISDRAVADPMTFTLENGVQVVLLPAEASKTVVLTRVNVGFLDEDVKRGQTGITHLLEHLFFRGTLDKPNEKQLKEAMKGLLAQYNASTDYTRTNYFLIGPSQNLPQLIELQGEQITRPLFAASDIKSEMNPVVEEALRDLANPHFSLFEFSLVAHADHPRMEHLMTGTPEQIRGYTPEMVREVYEKYYTGPNTVVVIAGGIEDIEATIEAVKKGFGALPNRPAPAPASAKVELKTKPSGIVPLVSVKAPGSNTRKLNINFPIEGTLENESAAALLAKYLNRRGEGSVLHPLYANGLLSTAGPSGMGADTVRDVLYVRLSLDLTEKGQREVPVITEYLSRLFGQIASEGIPAEVLEDLKNSFAINEVNGAGLLHMAEMLSDSAHEHGLEKLDRPLESVIEVESETIQKLAKRLLPEAAELTLYSSSLRGKENTIVDRANIAPHVKAANQANANEKIALDTEINPFLHLDTPTMYADPEQKKAAVLVVPESDNTHAEAAIEISYLRGMSARERLAANIAVLAFRLDSQSVRFFSMLEEAGVELSFRFDPIDMTLSVTAEGTSKAASQALHSFLEALRSYEPSHEAIALAKAHLAEELRNAPIQEVSRQALGMGINELLGAHGNRDLKKQMRLLKTVNALDVKKVLSVNRDRWGVRAILSGNWDDAMVEKIRPLLEAPHPEELPVTEHEAKLMARKRGYPALITRQAEVDRQGVARLYPVEVQRYSAEHWAFAVFSEVLSDRLAEYVRTSRGLVYAVQSGFGILPNGGAVLYIYGDTSQKAARMAMTYSVTVEGLLNEGMNSVEFEAARHSVLESILGMNGGASGLYNRYFSGLDPQTAAVAVHTLTQEKVIELVRPLLEKAAKIDAVAGGPNEISCQNLLTKSGAIGPGARAFLNSAIVRGGLTK